MIFAITAGVVLAFILMFLVMLKTLVHICAPNEVLIFSGKRNVVDGQTYGYRLITAGRGVRIPILENVHRMDLTTMPIDFQVVDAESKGRILFTVQGVANVKVAGEAPRIHNAVERFLGKSREEVAQIAKATLEGSFGNALATMTLEQVNEGKSHLAKRVIDQAKEDMAVLGLVVDTMEIQNIVQKPTGKVLTGEGVRA